MEKFLIQHLQSHESRQAQLTPEAIFTMLCSEKHKDHVLQSTQLTENELTGFVAEMSQDISAIHLVTYAEYVKRVVPFIFEMRQDHLLRSYLKENAFADLQIPMEDVKKLESIFPLMPHGWKPPKDKDEKEESDLKDFGGGRHSGRASGARKRTKTNPTNVLDPDRLASKRSASKTSGIGGEDHEEELRVQGRARLQVGAVGPGGRRRSISSKQPLAQVVRDTPNGRGYQRRRMLLGMSSAEDAMDQEHGGHRGSKITVDGSSPSASKQ
jgi:hypothetical protein